MSTSIIEKLPRRKVGEGKDHAKIELSSNQMTPGDALPEEFEIVQPSDGVNAEVPAHGQHGRSLEELQALLLKAAQDRGKSAFRGKSKNKPKAKN